MSKIAVTGSTGLIGTNLVKALESEGHEILQLSRRVGIDLLNKDLTKRNIEQFKPEVVYHLAANAAEARGQVSPIDMTERNMNIFLNVLVPSINVGVKRFIYTSSVAVYGDAKTPYDEKDTPRPKDVYGVNKLACEQILKILAKVHNFEYTIFRPHNLYGPYQDMRNPYRNVVAMFIRSLMEGTPVTLFGEGKMKRAFSYIDDVITVMVEALGEKYKDVTMNVGSKEAISIRELLETLEQVTGKSVEKKLLPARPQEIHDFVADHKVQDKITKYNETPLVIGLRRTWEAFSLPALEQVEDEIK